MKPAKRFDDRDALATALADDVAACLEAAVAGGRPASLAVAGGTTPGRFLTALGQRSIPWSRVRVTVTDERWVPPDHPDSNEGMVRRALLTNGAADAAWIGLWNPAPTPEVGRERAAAAVILLRPFDVVVLGMGTDGHVASLFPDTWRPAPSAAREPTCIAVPAAGARAPRLSLSLAALLDSKRLVLLVSGDDKLRVLEQASRDDTETSGAPPLPVTAVLRSRHPNLDVYWAP